MKNRPVLLVAVRVCALIFQMVLVRFKSLLSPWQHPSSLLWCGAGSENGAELSPGLRATGPIRHAGCHAAPEYWRRIRWWRWRNQTPSGYLPTLQLQLRFNKPCQRGPLGARQGLQERLGVLRQPRYPSLRPKLYYAAGQRCAQVC